MKLNFMVQGQKIELISAPSCIVGGSVNYLDAAFIFSSEWDELVKTAFFTCGDKTYQTILNENDCVTKGINLGPGTWVVNVVGEKIDSDKIDTYIPSSVCSINVSENGAVTGDDFPEVSPTLAELILSKSIEALNTANEVKEAAKKGEYDGGYYLPRLVGGYFYWIPSKEGMPTVEPIPMPEGGGSGTTFKTGVGLKMSNDGVLSVDSASDFNGDNTRPAEAAFMQSIVGNIEVLLKTI